MIPKIRIVDGKEVRGFKVMVAGGLGAQPMLAKVGFEFPEADELIPYIESVLRVFDRHGERASRHKARIKFLIQKIGFEEFDRLVKEEYKAIKHKSVHVDAEAWPDAALPAADAVVPAYTVRDPKNTKHGKRRTLSSKNRKGIMALISVCRSVTSAL
ncbi:hypothetical protein MKQ70_19475 [Chitinophaga sedimenti]|uniref:hypothetical protein n=1 Tax=Chitinophaga sedimenti TaxID=2033606 RepID=UPI00200496D8|nr:hypothetical protein [Chitinophaga sedimenti]MCK7557067.1 hypothetical protein [Chitinophaga sedimenti]